MKRLYHTILLCYVCIIAFLLIDIGDTSDNMSLLRQKRYLGLKNNTRFFLRLNFKANMVPWNQIFAQAIGFRINYDEPPDTFHPYHHLRVHRSTVYKHMEVLFDRNGLNGYHCIRRAICEMRMVGKPKGIYHRILQIVYRITSATDQWHKASPEECQQSITSCPLSMLEVSLFTDL